MSKNGGQSKELYIYPAVFTYDEDGISDGISIEFPDLPGCLSSADNDTEAVYNAKEALALSLCDILDSGFAPPEPTDISAVGLDDNQRVFPIDVWMPYYRGRIKTYCVKKTLTIPNWLNALAEERNVNFSRLLRNALTEYLGVADSGE